jgi:hypothetical protein
MKLNNIVMKIGHETYKVYGHVLDPLDTENKRVLTKGAGIFISFKVKAGKINPDLWHLKGKARSIYRKITTQ